MKEHNYYKAISFALTVLLGMSAGFNLHFKKKLDGIRYESYLDTIKVLHPVPVPRDSIVLRYKTVSLPSVPDTTPQNDTAAIAKTDSVKVRVPITQKMYEDEKYTAWVSGYEPSLDSLHLRIPTTVITMPEKTPAFEWSIGLQAGATWIPQHGVKPYIGIGVQFGIPLKKFYRKRKPREY